MSKFILGLDGGGTKTIGRLINRQSSQYWQCNSGPSSLTNDLFKARANVVKICKNLFEQAQCEAENVTAVLGLAGSGNPNLVAEFTQDLGISFANSNVISDARTSLYGANNGEPVAMVALGTGSVGMRMMEDGSEHIIGGWGFSIGDQGSGAKLGQMAIHQSLSEIDKNGKIISELGQKLSHYIGSQRAAILQWIRHASPQDYAAFAPLIFELKDVCHAAMTVLNIHLEKVSNLIQATRADTNLPLVIIGGLAQATKSIMSQEVVSSLSRAKGDAVDGACILAERHVQRIAIKHKVNFI